MLKKEGMATWKDLDITIPITIPGFVFVLFCFCFFWERESESVWQQGLMLVVSQMKRFVGFFSKSLHIVF